MSDDRNEYGVLSCLRVEKRRENYSYCCPNCDKWQKPVSMIVWVPDAIRMGDPASAIMERAQQNSLNGNFTGWCLKCAKKIGKFSLVDFLFGWMDPL